MQAVAPSLKVEVNPVNMRDPGEIERAVAAFARSTNGGLIVSGGAALVFHRDLIITLAARHKLPAVHSRREFVDVGGLISYGSSRTQATIASTPTAMTSKTRSRNCGIVRSERRAPPWQPSQ
jgi:putative ABC transport system substrate-binding protein